MPPAFRRNTVSLHTFMLTTFSCICLVVAATLQLYVPAESLLASMTSPNGWPQIARWLILPRLMSYGANHHPIHHFHQPALPYNRRPAFVISVCCSTPTCLSLFTSTSLLLAATVLCAVSRVVDLHSVVVHQLLSYSPAEGNRRFHLRTESLWIPVTKPGRTPPITPTWAFKP